METETSPKLVEDVLTPEITSPLSMNLEPISFSASTFPSELPSHFQNDLSNDWEAHATSLPLPSSAPTSIESTHGFASTSFSNLPSTHENNPFNPWFVPADQVGDSSPPFAPPSTTSPMFPSMNALNPTEPSSSEDPWCTSLETSLKPSFSFVPPSSISPTSIPSHSFPAPPSSSTFSSPSPSLHPPPTDVTPTYQPSFSVSRTDDDNDDDFAEFVAPETSSTSLQTLEPSFAISTSTFQSLPLSPPYFHGSDTSFPFLLYQLTQGQLPTDPFPAIQSYLHSLATSVHVPQDSSPLMFVPDPLPAYSRYLPNPEVHSETTYTALYGLMQLPMFDENISSKIKWRTSHIKKWTFHALDFSDTPHPPPRPTSPTASLVTSIQKMTFDPAVAEQALGYTEEQLRHLSLQQLQEVMGTLTAWSHEFNQSLEGLLDAKEQLHMDAEMYHKRISALVQQAQTVQQKKASSQTRK